MVDVAQLVEPRIVIPAVAGSSPAVHPTFDDGGESSSALWGKVFGPLAQLVEQLTLNQLVVGSIPTRPTIYPMRRPPVISDAASKVARKPYKTRVLASEDVLKTSLTATSRWAICGFWCIEGFWLNHRILVFMGSPILADGRDGGLGAWRNVLPVPGG